MNVENRGEKTKEGFLKHLGTVRGLRESMLAAGITLAQPILDNVGHTAQAEVAEIARDSTWQAGMEKMYDAADHGKAEAMSYFLQSEDGATLWVKPIIGHAMGVTLQQVQQNLQDEKEAVERFSKGKKVEVCALHSHGNNPILWALVDVMAKGPESNPLPYEIATKININRRLSMPPSYPDIRNTFGPDPLVGLVNAQGRATIRKDVVVDPVFVSYTHFFESREAAKTFRDGLRISQPPVTNSDKQLILDAQFKWLQYVNSSDEPTEKLLNSGAYDELRYAYALGNVHLRLNDRAGIEKEPPCAGAPYSK